MLAIAHQTLGAIPTNVDCDLSSSTNIELKWHPYASEWGLYSVKGDAGTGNEIECVGASPKLHLNQGQKYTFVQNDVSVSFGVFDLSQRDIGCSVAKKWVE